MTASKVGKKMAAAYSSGGDSKRPYTDLVKITPEQAKEWLEKGNTGNRSPSVRRIEALKRDIVAGRWQVDGGTIRFTRSMRLLDGQHRLMAIVLANVAVESMVTFNLKDSAMETIDQGKARTMADLFKINMGDKMPNPAAFSSIINSVAKIERGVVAGGVTGTLSFAEAQEVYAKYDNDIRWAFDIIGTRIEPATNSGGAPVLGAFAFCRKIDPDELEAFAYQFKNGEGRGNRKMTSQARILRQTIAKHIGSAATVPRAQLTALTLRGIEAFLEKEDLQFLRYDQNVLDRMVKRRAAAKGR